MQQYPRSDHKSFASPIGALEYRDIGSGAPVVFVHGMFTNGALWDDVVFYLPRDLRLIRPDLPLGGHHRPADSEADLGSRALANLLLQIIDRLDLTDVTLVGNSTGGAICQLAVASNDRCARRIRRLMLTNCDAFEHCPSRNAPAVVDLVRDLATPEGRRAFFETIAAEPMPDEQRCELLGGFLHQEDIRRDTLKVMSGMDPQQTLDAASRLIAFPGPVTLVWGLDDPLLPIAVGERLAAMFRDAELFAVPDARRLVPLDRPEIVAEAVIDLVRNRAADVSPQSLSSTRRTS